MPRSELVDIEVNIKHRTDKAVLVESLDTNAEAWLPLSLIEIDESGRLLVDITLPRSLAEEKGLI
ncbi:hypothetical protein [Devosia sp. Root105]|uniref:hypothetical protein n=1 Tax=Devosia sp. Root105 TaxID=1736423 RepID=UPI0006F61847|nr:hypothetical protein [Devosia sp. Root105]KQU96480.1 hypothetical protein ASC68_13965 [Devosia sp. Root105]